MKLRFGASLVAALTVSTLTHASPPAGPAAGGEIIEVIVNYCSRVDPADAAPFQRLLRGFTDNDRRDDERRASFEQTFASLLREKLEKLSRDEGLQDCKVAIAPYK